MTARLVVLLALALVGCPAPHPASDAAVVNDDVNRQWAPCYGCGGECDPTFGTVSAAPRDSWPDADCAECVCFCGLPTQPTAETPRVFCRSASFPGEPPIYVPSCDRDSTAITQGTCFRDRFR